MLKAVTTRTEPADIQWSAVIIVMSLDEAATVRANQSSCSTLLTWLRLKALYEFTRSSFLFRFRPPPTFPVVGMYRIQTTGS